MTGLRSIGAVKDTTTLTVTDPRTGKPVLHGDGSPMTLTLHGPYSAVYKTLLRDQQQKRVEEAAGGPVAPLTQAETEATMNALVRGCVAAWDLTLEGDEVPPCDPETVDAVFTEFVWLYDQCFAALGRVSDFFESPKTA